MKVKTDIFLPCHLVGDLLDLWRSSQIFSYLVIWLEIYYTYEGWDRYFPTLSSGWRPIRLMKVETDIFLPCHLVGHLLDLWRSRQIFLTLSSGWRPIRLVKVESDIFLPCHMVGELLDLWRSTDIFLPCHLVKETYEVWDRYFLTLSSGWRSVRHMKVETDIFLSCHLVGDLLDWWRSRQIFSYLVIWLETY